MGIQGCPKRYVKHVTRVDNVAKVDATNGHGLLRPLLQGGNPGFYHLDFGAAAIHKGIQT